MASDPSSESVSTATSITTSTAKSTESPKADPESEGTLEDEILLEIRDQVAWITINRPNSGNALTPPCRDRIRDIILELNTSYRARAIVITSVGEKLFCPGADLRYQYPNKKPEGVPERCVGDPRRMMLDGQYTLFPAILDSELPIIASVNGTAAGMGAHLAFACDLIIAAEHAKFVEVFTRRGLVVDALGAYLLPRTIGLHRAKELIFFADDLSAEKAFDWGLVNKVVPGIELMDTTQKWAKRLAEGPTKALGFSKALLNRAQESSRQQMMSDESVFVELNTHTEDSKEGVASFVERRDPTWLGY